MATTKLFAGLISREDEDTIYARVVLVNAANDGEAVEKVSTVAERNGCKMCAYHEGDDCPVYEVIDMRAWQYK